MTLWNNLTTATGTWQGTNRLHDPNTGKPADSPAAATLSSLADGLFYRFDYTWEYNGKTQQGSILLGAEREKSTLQAYWFDTWHMGEGVLTLTGTDDNSEKLTVLGSYPAPTGPDWGWSIELVPTTDTLQLFMYNFPPELEGEIAVEMTLKHA